MPGYAFPVEGFQKQTIPVHWGIAGAVGAADLFAARGTPLRAMVDGTVSAVGIGDALGGNWVMLKGDPDTKSLDYYYAHMNKPPLVSKGQRVTAGQKIGEVGDSGNAAAAGPHLHIGIGLGIINGSGAWGGAGNPWPGNNCTAYLNHVLSTIGSGPVTRPEPEETNYETVARYLTDQNGPILVALRDRKSALLKQAAALTIEANEIDNVINEIIRNRPA